MGPSNGDEGVMGGDFTRTVLSIAAAITLSAGGGASAQNYSTDRYDVGELDDSEGCFIGGDWTLAGRSEINLEISQTLAGEVYVGVWSYGWSRPASDIRKVMGLVFWPAGGGEQKVFALFAIPTGVELASLEKPGLLAMVEPDEAIDFLDTFGSGQSFTLMTRDAEAEDGTDFDTVLEGNLAGSGLALSRMRTCVSNVQRREAARLEREAGVAHIARDPFKPTGDQTSE